MSSEKLKRLRERTVLVKAANVIEKQGGVDRIITTLLKSTKTSGNALANSTVAKTKSEKGDKKKSDNFLKSAMYASSGARPGQPITSMGTGLAPFAIQAQPKVAQNSVEIAGRGLKTAYPGLTEATKSTTAMKRNAGSIMASANRQKPKKAKSELVAPTASLTVAPVIQQQQVGKTAYASVDLAQLEKQAMSKLAEMNKEAIVGLIRAGWSGLKALRAGKGLRTAYQAAKAPETFRQARLMQGGARTMGVGRSASEASTGARMLTGAKITAEQAGRSGLLGKAQQAIANRFRGGIGMGRNIYQQGKGPGSKFIGEHSFLNYLPGGSRLQLMRYNRLASNAGQDPIRLLRQGTATGGIVNRVGKSLVRGTATGGALGYGSSFLPYVGDPSTKDVGFFDPQRLRMAKGGAMIGASAFGGGGASSLVARGLGLGMTPYSMDKGLDVYAEGMANLQGAKQLRGAGGRHSKMDAVINSRNKQLRQDNTAARRQIRSLDAAANRARQGGR